MAETPASTPIKIVVVGAGALGSHFLLFARNIPASFKVIDFDRVESKNVLSQVHARTSVGRNKAQALQQTLLMLFGQKIDAIPHKLEATNASTLLKDANLIVDCLDNAAARTLVQDYARQQNIPCLHGALAPNGELGRVVWDHLFVIDSEDVAGQPTCEGGEHLPFVGTVGAMLAEAARLFVREKMQLSTMILPAGTVILEKIGTGLEENLDGDSNIK